MNMNNKIEKSSELKSRPEQLSTSKNEKQGKGTQNDYVNFKQREVNRQLPTERVLGALHRWMPRQHGLAKVVGNWVWIQFAEPPAQQIRQELSELGFHWNRKRQLWQHPCGTEVAGNSATERSASV